jgi:hypothetical protein
MGIYDSRQHNFPLAIDLVDILSVPLDPGISQSIFRLAHRDNLPSRAQHRAILDDFQLAQVSATPWTGAPRPRTQRNQLANIGQKDRSTRGELSFHCSRRFSRSLAFRLELKTHNHTTTFWLGGSRESSVEHLRLL